MESVALLDGVNSLTDYQVVEFKAVQVLDEVAVTVVQPRTAETPQFSATCSNPKVKATAVFWHNNGE